MTAVDLRIMMEHFTPARQGDVHIAFAVDAHYVQHMGVAMTSIVVNNPGVNVQFHVIFDTIAAADVLKLRQLSDCFQVPINFYKLCDQTLFRVMKTGQHFSPAIYYRILIPQILPPDLPQVIYLDADLVCVGDITRLWRIALGDAPLAARLKPADDEQIKRLGLKNGVYLHSGALVFNMPLWRQQQLAAQILTFVLKNDDRLQWPDQDALAAVLDGRIFGFEDSLHTVIDCAEHSGTILENSVLVHFAGMCKPWQQWCPDERKQLYWQYLRQSPWCDAVPELPQTAVQAIIAARLENSKGNREQVEEILRQLMVELANR